MSREGRGKVKKIAESVGGQTEAFGWLRPGKAVGATITASTWLIERDLCDALRLFLYTRDVFCPTFQSRRFQWLHDPLFFAGKPQCGSSARATPSSRYRYPYPVVLSSCLFRKSINGAHLQARSRPCDMQTINKRTSHLSCRHMRNRDAVQQQQAGGAVHAQDLPLLMRAIAKRLQRVRQHQRRPRRSPGTMPPP